MPFGIKKLTQIHRSSSVPAASHDSTSSPSTSTSKAGKKAAKDKKNRSEERHPSSSLHQHHLHLPLHHHGRSSSHEEPSQQQRTAVSHLQHQYSHPLYPQQQQHLQQQQQAMHHQQLLQKQQQEAFQHHLQQRQIQQQQQIYESSSRGRVQFNLTNPQDNRVIRGQSSLPSSRSMDGHEMRRLSLTLSPASGIGGQEGGGVTTATHKTSVEHHPHSGMILHSAGGGVGGGGGQLPQSAFPDSQINRPQYITGHGTLPIRWNKNAIRSASIDIVASMSGQSGSGGGGGGIARSAPVTSAGMMTTPASGVTMSTVPIYVDRNGVPYERRTMTLMRQTSLPVQVQKSGGRVGGPAGILMLTHHPKVHPAAVSFQDQQQQQQRSQPPHDLSGQQRTNGRNNERTLSENDKVNNNNERNLQSESTTGQQPYKQLRLNLRAATIGHHPGIKRQESVWGPHPELDDDVDDGGPPTPGSARDHSTPQHLPKGRTSTSGGFYDDDPGIMSEVETSATGNFKRASRVRSSLPIVRTPSKSHDRSLGLVFLQYRTETKRALLPNEVTSLDTVKALFVRSFKGQINMPYLNSRNVRIYIHDSGKDIFYELEDVKDVKDRSVLRIYEQDLENGTWQPVGGLRPEHPRVLNQQVNQELIAAAQASRSGAATGPPSGPVSGNWMMDDPSYFSEPEFESNEFPNNQNQHIHRSKRERASFGGPIPGPSAPVNSSAQSQYYGTIIIPAYRTAAMMQQQQQQNNNGNQQQGAPRPPERGKVTPYAGYSQTMPRNMSLATAHATYGNLSSGSPSKGSHQQQQLAQQPSPASQQQRSVSPDLVSKRQQQHKDQIVMAPSGPGAPPKPQRSFTALIGGAQQQRSPQGSGPSGAQIGGMTMMSPHAQTSQPMSPNHGPHVFTRPLPERPFSVAGQYHQTGSGPDRRSFPTEYTGYLSSPERRLPSGNVVRTVYGQVIPGQSGPMSLPYESDLYTFGGSRPSSVAGVVDDVTRAKMENMERQLMNLTGLVQAALQPGSSTKERVTTKSTAATTTLASMYRRLFKADKPTKSAIKRQSSAPVYPTTTTSDKSRPPPPPKPSSFSPYMRSSTESQVSIAMTPEMYHHLQTLKAKTKDLKSELFSLRNMARQQSQNTKEILRETCNKVQQALSFLNSNDPIERRLRLDRLRLSRDEEAYRNDVRRLDKDLTDLEAQVEELRSNVINRRCKVNMSDVEHMAHVLSRASKTVADLKLCYPHLQDSLRNVMQAEMEVVVREEKFLKEEPDKLETALRRCKKLTGTLVTLKRLASVQEQRSSAAVVASSSPSTVGGRSSPSHSSSTAITSHAHPKTSPSSSDHHHHHQHGSRDVIGNHHHHPSSSSSSGHPLTLPKEPSSGRSLEGPTHTVIHVTPATPTLKTDPKGENALDALLEELQTFAKPSSGSKKPVPPPRSSSRINEQAQQLMLLSSLTAAALQSARSATGVMRSNSIPASAMDIRPKSTPPIHPYLANIDETLDAIHAEERATAAAIAANASNSSISSIDSQAGLRSRQQVLEDRHQELLRKQRLLQEQYSKLQMLSRGQIPQGLLYDLKKTGSESNIMSKSGPPGTPGGSLSQLTSHSKGRAPLPPNGLSPASALGQPIVNGKGSAKGTSNNVGKHVETQKIYETDIL